MSPVIGTSSTMSVWMRTTQVGNNTSWQAPGITGVEHNGSGNDIFFGWIDATGRIGVTAGNGTAAKSNFVVNDNVWRHVTITRDHVSGLVEFYVNGVLNGTGVSETGAKTTYFDSFGIIGDTGGTPEDYNGYLDEVRIFSTVQTAARIKADYKYMMDTHLDYNPAELQ
jgi:MSHA biogenesis protein MshQ